MRTYRRVQPNLVPFVDYHTNILLVFILLLLFSTVKKADESIELSEIYQVTMTWDVKSATDMDLWAKDPTGNIVGFNRREGGQGSLFALKRDDLGKRSDMRADGTAVEINEEVISIRGTKEGEYVINGHCYRKNAEEQTVTVKAKLTRIKPFKEIIVKERTFKVTGDEQTFFRFKMDNKCEVTETNELQGKVAVLQSEEGEADVSGGIFPYGNQTPSGMTPPVIPQPTPR